MGDPRGARRTIHGAHDGAPLTELSKSRFLAGLQCPKRLWLQAHRPLPFAEGAAETAKREGRAEIVRQARARSPGAAFDAPFQFAGVRVTADVLREDADGFALEVVKASTRVKGAHVPEVALKAAVLRGAGVPLARAGVLHLDADYVLDEGGLDPARLFRFVEVGTELDVEGLADGMRGTLQAGEPDVAPGAHCFRPHTCPFTDVCIAPPGPFDLRRVPQGEALAKALGVGDARRVPPDASLKELQRRAIDCLVHGREHVGPGLRDALEGVAFPLGFLDFEMCQPPVPRYVGTRVYQALPTQWSLHVQGPDGSLAHRAFLHDADSDPREPFAVSLLDALAGVGSVVVYSPYEAMHVRALAAQLPRYGAALLALTDRFVDLLAIVREHYYHPAFDGSFSIKRVLPALVPALAYDDLEIRDGNAAALLYLRTVDATVPPEERAALRDALLRYCERDTLAMVRVREALLARA
jgi:hypothetical protein